MKKQTRIIKKLFKQSKAKRWNQMISEWKYMGKVETYSECLCGRALKHAYIYENTTTCNVISLDGTCKGILKKKPIVSYHPPAHKPLCTTKCTCKKAYLAGKLVCCL